MNKSKVAHVHHTTSERTNEVPESGTHRATDDYKKAEAQVLARHGDHWGPFAETRICASTVGDFLPLLFASGETDGTDLAEAALHSIRQDLEVLAHAVHDMEPQDIERALIKVQSQMTIAAELHRRSKAHARAATEANRDASGVAQ